MANTISVESIASDGTDFVIIFASTGGDTANITLKTSNNGISYTDNYSIYNVQASANKLICLTTVFFFHPSIECDLDLTRPPGAATVTITVSNAPAHNGSTDYPVSRADGAKISQFLVTSGFPGLG